MGAVSSLFDGTDHGSNVWRRLSGGFFQYVGRGGSCLCYVGHVPLE